jgi:hypothetical protein
MRNLTESEAYVIQTLIGAAPVTERALIQQCRLPRSTFQYARRRLYARGWLHDRYVPHPHVTGVRSVSAELLWPFAARRGSDLQRLQSDPHTVVAWSSPNIIFYVRMTAEGAPAADSLVSNAQERSLQITCPATAEGIPAYFDAAGPLAVLFGLARPRSYPLRIREIEVASGDEREERPVSPDRIRAATNLVLTSERRRDFHLVGRSVPPFPLGLPRNQAQLVADGLVQWRVFPDLGRLPSFRGRTLHDFVFVHGTMIRKVSGTRLLEEIVSDCGAYPYLAMVDGEGTGDVLLVFLAVGHGTEPSRSLGRKISVQAFFEDRLRSITIVRESMKWLRPVIDHRYEGLMSYAGSNPLE